MHWNFVIKMEFSNLLLHDLCKGLQNERLSLRLVFENYITQMVRYGSHWFRTMKFLSPQEITSLLLPFVSSSSDAGLLKWLQQRFSWQKTEKHILVVRWLLVPPTSSEPKEPAKTAHPMSLWHNCIAIGWPLHCGGHWGGQASGRVEEKMGTYIKVVHLQL